MPRMIRWALLTLTGGHKRRTDAPLRPARGVHGENPHGPTRHLAHVGPAARTGAAPSASRGRALGGGVRASRDRRSLRRARARDGAASRRVGADPAEDQPGAVLARALAGEHHAPRAPLRRGRALTLAQPFFAAAVAAACCNAGVGGRPGTERCSRKAASKFFAISP